MKIKSSYARVFAGAIILFCATAARADVQYILHDLGTLGGTIAYGEGINASGQVAGAAYLSGNLVNHAYRWTPDFPNFYTGSMLDLGTLGGTNSYGTSINNAGWVAGYSETVVGNDQTSHAFLYDGSMHDLGTFGGRASIGTAINSSGQVVGYSFTTNNAAQHAFLYNGTSMLDLGTLGGLNSSAYGINDVGQVVGYSDTNLFDVDHHVIVHAFMYDGVMHDLGTLGGDNSTALAINNSGEITGDAQIPTSSLPGHVPPSHAYRWIPTTNNAATGTMHDLGTPGPNDDTSLGVDINNSGDVVGNATYNGISYGSDVLFPNAGGLVDVSAHTDHPGGMNLEIIRELNDVNEFVGMGRVGGGPTRALLVTPIPEPSSFALAALAGLSVLALRRRGR